MKIKKLNPKDLTTGIPEKRVDESVFCTSPPATFLSLSGEVRMSTDREAQIIQRIRETLKNEGISDVTIRDFSKYGIGSAKSYFEALVDFRLEGKEDPTARDVWDQMKAQINYLTSSLVKASEDYAKLESRLRGSKEDERDRLRDTIEKDKQSKQMFTDETYLMQIQSLKNIEVREKSVVYILELTDFKMIGNEDDVFIGVFSSHEKANEEYLKYIGSLGLDGDRYAPRIAEYRVDDDYNYAEKVDHEDQEEVKDNWTFTILDSHNYSEEKILEMAKDVQLEELREFPIEEGYQPFIANKENVEEGVLYTIKVKKNDSEERD